MDKYSYPFGTHELSLSTMPGSFYTEALGWKWYIKFYICLWDTVDL